MNIPDHPSWDVVSLRTYLEGQLQALDQRRAAAFVSHDREHELIDKALEKALQTLDRRLEDMNELRDQITAERGMFPTNAVLDAKVGTLEGRIDEQRRRVDVLRESSSAIRGRDAALLAAFTLIVTLALAAMKFL